jgi:hypothetical protein
MDTTSQKQHYLHEMFPYDIAGKMNADLKKGLLEYRFLLKALSEASHHFQHKNLERFDALVGENACQIRAFKIAILASRGEVKFEDLDPSIEAALAKMEELLEERAIGKLMLNDAKLDEILCDEGLFIPLTPQQLYISQAFLLSEIKEESYSTNYCFLEIKDKPVPRKLKRICSSISTNFAHELGNKLRKHLSKQSVDYVRKLASDFEDETLLRMLSDEFAVTHNNLSCVSCFWTYKTLIEAALRESIPIVMHAQFLRKDQYGYKIENEEVLYFEPKNGLETRIYTEKNLEHLHQNKPACIIQGTVCLPEDHRLDIHHWKNQILANSIENIILSCAASHRQFPDPNVQFPTLGKEYTDYKQKGENEGYSRDNQALFYINHVFPMSTCEAKRSLVDEMKIACNIS